jgi:hypothetical protein
LVGDIKYTENATPIYDNGQIKASIEFLTNLQNLMEEYGVVKIDISTDAFKYLNIIKTKENV